MHAESLEHVVEVAAVVVNDGPATTPAWETVDLRQGASANDRHSGGHVTERDEWSLWVVGQAVVDLVTDDDQFVLVGHSQDFTHVLLSETGSTRI